jgi:hypothetical protein
VNFKKIDFPGLCLPTGVDFWNVTLWDRRDCFALENVCLSSERCRQPESHYVIRDWVLKENSFCQVPSLFLVLPNSARSCRPGINRPNVSQSEKMFIDFLRFSIYETFPSVSSLNIYRLRLFGHVECRWLYVRADIANWDPGLRSLSFPASRLTFQTLTVSKFS